MYIEVKYLDIRTFFSLKRIMLATVNKQTSCLTCKYRYGNFAKISVNQATNIITSLLLAIQMIFRAKYKFYSARSLQSNFNKTFIKYRKYSRRLHKIRDMVGFFLIDEKCQHEIANIGT